MTEAQIEIMNELGIYFTFGMYAVNTKNPVVSKSNSKAPAMMSGGVTIATNMANRCCKAANNVSRKGGLSFKP